ncbi:MAG: hypothetical protein AB9836_08395 [Aminipila sp.]
MDIIIYGVGFVLGVIIFGIINNIFNIYYFGFKGMAGTFMGCWFAGVIIVMFFGVIAIWLLIIFVILWILSKIFKGNVGEAE